MSYITFDYKCKNCGALYPDCMVQRCEMDSQECSECKEPLHRMPAGPPTTFKFGDRSSVKSKKAVSLRDPHTGADSKNFSVD